jgi:glucose/arabinose dehydrogenase
MSTGRANILGAVFLAVAAPGLARPELGAPVPLPRLQRTEPRGRVEVLLTGLQVPWGLAWLPDGRLLLTERPGHVLAYEPRSGRVTLLLTLSGVARGEGGLLGIAVEPGPSPAWVYLYYTAPTGNRISRFRMGVSLSAEEVLVDRIPAAQFHDGGSLAFGPDGMLYAGTGDARQPDNAQDLGSLSGKVLRLTPEGDIPNDNPFPGSPVWAYGFRNVSGLAWDGAGQLYATMHGPSGEFPGLEAKDSIYRVARGGNHGWPLWCGVGPAPFIAPVVYYPGETVPPGGAAFYRGDLYITSLAAEDVRRYSFDGAGRVTGIERWFAGRYGRLRACAVGPDGALYLTTSNRDGRANHGVAGSDLLLRVSEGRVGKKRK